MNYFFLNFFKLCIPLSRHYKGERDCAGVKLPARSSHKQPLLSFSVWVFQREKAAGPLSPNFSYSEGDVLGVLSEISLAAVGDPAFLEEMSRKACLGS